MKTQLVNDLADLRRTYPTMGSFLEDIRAELRTYAESLVKRTIKELGAPLQEVATDSGVICIWHDSERPTGECLADCVGLGFPEIEAVQESMKDEAWDYSYKQHRDGSIDDYASIDSATITAWVEDLETWLEQKEQPK